MAIALSRCLSSIYPRRSTAQQLPSLKVTAAIGVFLALLLPERESPLPPTLVSILRDFVMENISASTLQTTTMAHLHQITRRHQGRDSPGYHRHRLFSPPKFFVLSPAWGKTLASCNSDGNWRRLWAESNASGPVHTNATSEKIQPKAVYSYTPSLNLCDYGETSNTTSLQLQSHPPHA